MITRPFSYFGSKHALASLYPSPGNVIVEPFAGSAGYSCLHSEKQVHLFDVDPYVCQAWRYLLTATEEEIVALPAEAQSLSEFPQESRPLIGFWFANGRATPAQKPSSWMKSGDRPNAYWGESAKRQLAEILPAVRHWTMTQDSWERIDVSGFGDSVTWFVDPPYSSKGGRSYFCNRVNYSRLAEWCRELPGQVIVCEEEGASWLPFTFLKDVKTGRKARIREVVYLEVH